MIETPVVFGDTRSVVGVVCEPNPGQPRTGLGCLLLNAGSIHRVGPQRLYVKVARRLAAAGVASLRFDCSGVGDSPLRIDHVPFAEGASQEAQRAMDVLSAHGCTRYLVLGVCWGADNALRVCRDDPRVVGAALVDFYFVDSLRYWVRLYRSRLLSLRSWRNLLGGGSSVLRMGLGIALRALRGLVPGRQRLDDDSVMPIQKPSEVARQLREQVHRGVHLAFVFTAGSGSWDHYRARFAVVLRDLAATGRVSVQTMEQADHLFTLQRNQARLVDHLVEWAGDVARRGGSATAAGDRPDPAAAASASAAGGALTCGLPWSARPRRRARAE